MTERVLDNSAQKNANDAAHAGKAFKADAANEEFRRLAQIYSWDMRLEEAMKWPERLLRRVMDIGTLEDIVLMEQAIGKKHLACALRNAPAGALRHKSWTFWHHRLNLVENDKQCPSPPVRHFA